MGEATVSAWVGACARRPRLLDPTRQRDATDSFRCDVDPAVHGAAGEVHGTYARLRKGRAGRRVRKRAAWMPVAWTSASRTPLRSRRPLDGCRLVRVESRAATRRGSHAELRAAH